MVIKMKIVKFRTEFLFFGGILFEYTSHPTSTPYKIQYSVDAAWCNFHLDKMDRDVIKTVKLWQETTNKLTGWKCF